jgi:hypothetical protein
LARLAIPFGASVHEHGLADSILLGGIRQRKGFMGEIKIGAIDSPDVKMGIGWTW